MGVIAKRFHARGDSIEGQDDERFGFDIQVIGVGGQGNVVFHEAGNPFKGSRVLIVQLEETTIKNSVTCCHFATGRDSPRFAVSMGAELVHEARNVIFLANGERERVAVARSMLEGESADVPICYGQHYGRSGEDLVYIVDALAGADLAKSGSTLASKDMELENLRA